MRVGGHGPFKSIVPGRCAFKATSARATAAPPPHWPAGACCDSSSTPARFVRPPVKVAPAPRPCGPRQSGRRRDPWGAVLRQSGITLAGRGRQCAEQRRRSEKEGRDRGVAEERQVTAARGAPSGGSGHASTAVIPIFPP